MLLEAASYTATATLITRNTPELAAPIAVLWWVTLLATPLLLVFAIPFNEYTRVFNFGVSRELTQPLNPLPPPPVLTHAWLSTVTSCQVAVCRSFYTHA